MQNSATGGADMFEDQSLLLLKPMPFNWRPTGSKEGPSPAPQDGADESEPVLQGSYGLYKFPTDDVVVGITPPGLGPAYRDLPVPESCDAGSLIQAADKPISVSVPQRTKAPRYELLSGSSSTLKSSDSMRAIAKQMPVRNDITAGVHGEEKWESQTKPATAAKALVEKGNVWNECVVHKVVGCLHCHDLDGWASEWILRSLPDALWVLESTPWKGYLHGCGNMLSADSKGDTFPVPRRGFLPSDIPHFVRADERWAYSVRNDVMVACRGQRLKGLRTEVRRQPPQSPLANEAKIVLQITLLLTGYECSWEFSMRRDERRKHDASTMMTIGSVKTVPKQSRITRRSHGGWAVDVFSHTTNGRRTHVLIGELPLADVDFQDPVESKNWPDACGCPHPDASCVRASLIEAKFVDGGYLNEYRQLHSFLDRAHIILENFNQSSTETSLPVLPEQLVMGDWCFNQFGLERLGRWRQTRPDFCLHPAVKQAKRLRLATCFRMATVGCACTSELCPCRILICQDCGNAGRVGECDNRTAHNAEPLPHESIDGACLAIGPAYSPIIWNATNFHPDSAATLTHPGHVYGCSTRKGPDDATADRWWMGPNTDHRMCVKFDPLHTVGLEKRGAELARLQRNLVSWDDATALPTTCTRQCICGREVVKASWNDDYRRVVFDGDRLVACDSECRFVAISYTWTAPGCCSECRATGKDFLTRLVRATGMPVWIDKICVPQEAPSTPAGLLDMASIYSSAEYVLIIEPGIDEGISSPMFLRNALWNTRSWTILEAVAARSIALLVAGTIVHCGDPNTGRAPALISHQWLLPQGNLEAWALMELGRRKCTVLPDLAFIMIGLLGKQVNGEREAMRRANPVAWLAVEAPETIPWMISVSSSDSDGNPQHVLGWQPSRVELGDAVLTRWISQRAAAVEMRYTAAGISGSVARCTHCLGLGALPDHVAAFKIVRFVYSLGYDIGNVEGWRDEYYEELHHGRRRGLAWAHALHDLVAGWKPPYRGASPRKREDVLPEQLRLELTHHGEKLLASFQGCGQCCMLTSSTEKCRAVGTALTKSTMYFGLALQPTDSSADVGIEEVRSRVRGWAFGVIRSPEQTPVLIRGKESDEALYP